MNGSAALLCMAMAVYQESRSEPLIGQFAVAHVILNRVEDKSYPNDVCAVVTQPSQFAFSWRPPRNSKAWDQAVMVAQQVLSGSTIDPTGGSLYYHRDDRRVKWTAGMVGQLIGHHIFWRKPN